MRTEFDLEEKKGERRPPIVLGVVVVCVVFVAVISSLSVVIGMQKAEAHRLRLQITPQIEVPDKTTSPITVTGTPSILFSTVPSTTQTLCENNCQFGQPFNETTCECMCEDGLLGKFCQFPQKGLIGQSCGNSSDCVVPESECRSEGVCGCLVGHSFQSSTHTCEANCTAYGNTFQVFVGHGITGNNAMYVIGVDRPEDCIPHCLYASGFTCKAFDYIPRNRKCDLSAVDISDVPVAHAYWPDAIHYQRNCLN